MTTSQRQRDGRSDAEPAPLAAYVGSISRTEDPELVALRERTATLPFVAMMQGAPLVGQLLQFLIRLTKARRIVEVGVFTGCSTLAMAAALDPDGTIVAIDVTNRWVVLGQESWKRTGVDGRIDLRIGDGAEVLDTLIAEDAGGTFDLAFVDANKDAYPIYFERCLTLLRPNGVLVFDNVFFGGRVLPGCTDADIRQEVSGRPRWLQDLYVGYADGLRRFNARIACDARVDLVVLPALDGITLARKR